MMQAITRHEISPQPESTCITSLLYRPSYMAAINRTDIKELERALAIKRTKDVAKRRANAEKALHSLAARLDMSRRVERELREREPRHETAMRQAVLSAEDDLARKIRFYQVREREIEMAEDKRRQKRTKLVEQILTARKNLRKAEAVMRKTKEAEERWKFGACLDLDASDRDALLVSHMTGQEILADNDLCRRVALTMACREMGDVTSEQEKWRSARAEQVLEAQTKAEDRQSTANDGGGRQEQIRTSDLRSIKHDEEIND